MIRFSRVFFKNGVNSLQEVLSNIAQNQKTKIKDFFNLTAQTFEELITNNKNADYKNLFQIINQLSESYQLDKKERRVVFLLVGYYIFLSEFFPNRDEREPFTLLVIKLFEKTNSDYLIYLEDGHVLGGCSIINLEYKSFNIIWNTYVFVTPLARGRGLLKKFYDYLETKKPAMIIIEVENPYSYFNINLIRDTLGGENYYPSTQEHWELLRGFGSEIDHFSRLMIWSKMGFLLPIYKVKNGQLKYSLTYPYVQPKLGSGRKSVSKLVLLFKVFDPQIAIGNLKDISELQEIIHNELSFIAPINLEFNYKIKFTKIHNSHLKFNSLAMSALRASLKNIFKLS